MKNIDTKTFWSCIALGIIIRLAVMLCTNSFEFESWSIAGELTAMGKNVYANTGRYNYGPVWFSLLGLFWKAASYFGNNMLAFRIFIVGTLTLADFCMAEIISKKIGNFWGVLFFLNPVSILLSGYNNQFDNTAVLLGALGVLCLEESSQKNSVSMKDIYGIMLLSLSLITKHILYAFPLWILFNRNINMRKKFLYAFIPSLLFLLSFAPYWSVGHEGIMRNVFMYRSLNNFPLFAAGILTRSGINMPFLTLSGLYVFVLLMVISAYIFRKEDIFTSFLLYTISLVCFSSASITNYCAIPCMALILMFRKKSYIYFASSVLLMLCGHKSVNFLIRLIERSGTEINAFMNFLYAERETDVLTNMQTAILTLIAWMLLAYLVSYKVRNSANP